MTAPIFAKTHNLIAFLAKPTKNEGFKQIIDFLNGSSVRYVLIANPTIRTSYIRQFWSTAKVKTVNDEIRVQALIDAKRVNIKESFIRHTLKLDDEEVKNIKAGVPFYMFPRFVQLIVDHQLGDMSHHQDIYDNPSLTKKVFANMKRVGTSFSRVITPLFENMLVLAAEEVGQAQDDSAKIDTATPDEDKDESFKQRRMIADMNEDVEVNLEKAQAKAYNLDLQHSEKVLSMHDIDEEEPAKVEEVLKVVTTAKLITKVVTTAESATTATQVPKASAPRRRKGVVIQDPKETATSVIVHTEHYNSNQAFLERVKKEVTVQEKEIEEEGNKRQEATPLASKVPAVYYHIHLENNKPYYKIIRADGTHKLFLSFITLLKNFDREDLETL
nr:hypothetical protein [Tanacetum cinerariifolium]